MIVMPCRVCLRPHNGLCYATCSLLFAVLQLFNHLDFQLIVVFSSSVFCSSSNFECINANMKWIAEDMKAKAMKKAMKANAVKAKAIKK